MANPVLRTLLSSVTHRLVELVHSGRTPEKLAGKYETKAQSIRN